jgi:ParB-like chromosome segregation protein Spo0J
MMQIDVGFSLDCVSLPAGSIVPSRKLGELAHLSKKVQQIRSSIEEIGLIEPLSVTQEIKGLGKHMLLDGHVRFHVLGAMGVTAMPCLIAKDDEAYTYNNRVNRLSTIQEHLMIRRAIERGVSADRVAKALNVDVSHVNKKAKLLDGICAEAQELLKDRVFSVELSRFLRQMKPTRQVECVELMLAANNLTASYAEAMLIATCADQLVEGKKTSRASAGVTQEQMAKMEREMASVQRKYKAVEQSYGQDVLNLVVARAYLVRLLGNSAVVRYLKQRQPDVLVEFEAIAKTATLE